MCARECAHACVGKANDTYPSILYVLCRLMTGCNIFTEHHALFSSWFPGPRVYRATGYCGSVALFVAPAARSCGGAGPDPVTISGRRHLHNSPRCRLGMKGAERAGGGQAGNLAEGHRVGKWRTIGDTHSHAPTHSLSLHFGRPAVSCQLESEVPPAAIYVLVNRGMRLRHV